MPKTYFALTDRIAPKLQLSFEAIDDFVSWRNFIRQILLPCVGNLPEPSVNLVVFWYLQSKQLLQLKF